MYCFKTSSIVALVVIAQIGSIAAQSADGEKLA
jgi:hypothetical protein